MATLPPLASTSGVLPTVAPVTKFVPASASERELLLQPPLLPFLYGPTGRDALLRLVQYSLRLVFYLRKRRNPSSSLVRLLALVSLLSAIRRLSALVALSSSTLQLIKRYLPTSSKHSRNKGKAREVAMADPSRPWQPLPLELFIDFSRNLLDFTATVSDNLYLFARLRVLPFSDATTRLFDRVAVVSALGSALAGLMLVHNAELDVWAEGRTIRKGVLALEERMEKAVVEAAGEENDERKKRLEDEEKRLGERARTERRRLKRLRDELTELWWERTRLGAEGLFSTWDVLELNLGSESVRTWSGIVSAGIMFSQSWQEYYGRH
ncbi:hypothetical protein RQP46_010271 [Phenoliferia psychrophenolica]